MKIQANKWPFKYRGIKVEDLGNAMASNIFTDKEGFEILAWKDFQIFKN
jgi:hypothetical protein